MTYDDTSHMLFWVILAIALIFFLYEIDWGKIVSKTRATLDYIQYKKRQKTRNKIYRKGKTL